MAEREVSASLKFMQHQCQYLVLACECRNFVDHAA